MITNNLGTLLYSFFYGKKVGQDKDGNTRYTTEVVGDQMTMLGGRSSSGNSTTDSAASNEPKKDKGSADISSDDADDLPF